MNTKLKRCILVIFILIKSLKTLNKGESNDTMYRNSKEILTDWIRVLSTFSGFCEAMFPTISNLLLKQLHKLSILVVCKVSLSTN